eukprot:snap_masked-scaffold_9-processed-gene-3.26-mRNA-1 protein AED:0.62 eAED:1.00 QI:0/-1/0/1/-1/1/1/0/141
MPKFLSLCNVKRQRFMNEEKESYYSSGEEDFNTSKTDLQIRKEVNELLQPIENLINLALEEKNPAKYLSNNSENDTLRQLEEKITDLQEQINLYENSTFISLFIFCLIYLLDFSSYLSDSIFFSALCFSFVYFILVKKSST